MVSDIVLICVVIGACLTLPVIACIGVAGWYFVSARREQESLLREQLHDSEITSREHMRTQRALAKEGQQSGGLDWATLAQAFLPVLMQKGVQLSPQVNTNGQEIQQSAGMGGPPVR
jgi:hypothetical protein